jgi:hypothetical protein
VRLLTVFFFDTTKPHAFMSRRRSFEQVIAPSSAVRQAVAAGKTAEVERLLAAGAVDVNHPEDSDCKTNGANVSCLS